MDAEDMKAFGGDPAENEPAVLIPSWLEEERSPTPGEWLAEFLGVTPQELHDVFGVPLTPTYSELFRQPNEVIRSQLDVWEGPAGPSTGSAPPIPTR